MSLCEDASMTILPYERSWFAWMGWGLLLLVCVVVAMGWHEAAAAYCSVSITTFSWFFGIAALLVFLLSQLDLLRAGLGAGIAATQYFMSWGIFFVLLACLILIIPDDPLGGGFWLAMLISYSLSFIMSRIALWGHGALQERPLKPEALASLPPRWCGWVLALLVLCSSMIMTSAYLAPQESYALEPLASALLVGLYLCITGERKLFPRTSLVLGYMVLIVTIFATCLCVTRILTHSDDYSVLWALIPHVLVLLYTTLERHAILRCVSST